MQALKELDSKGLISLESYLNYKPKDVKKPHPPACLNEAVPQPVNVPESVEQIKELKVIRVQNDLDRKTWNTIMAQEHRLGANMHPERSIKFLVVSEHGVLGAASFCSASLHIKDRDEWIGWTDEERRNGLDDVVVKMNRFLVRESVHLCRNFPSKSISLLLDALRKEWKAVYDRKIYLVETFVDPREFDGTTYKASNWIEVGKTAGRGYNDRTGTADVGSKILFMYPLVPDFRKRLGLPDPEDKLIPEWKQKGPLAPYEGLKGNGWAEQEFGSCNLGHKDRNDRLIYSAERIALAPNLSIPAVMGTDTAGIKGWQRLIASPFAEINAESIMSGHRDCTCRRMLNFRKVLEIQDGMDINLAKKTKTKSLGPIESNHPGSVTLGLKEHGTIAVGVEWQDDEIPQPTFLGILKASFWARPMPESQKGQNLKKVPVEQKESYLWVKHAECVNAVGEYTPDTLHINVCDLGSDSALFLAKVIDMEHC